MVLETTSSKSKYWYRGLSPWPADCHLSCVLSWLFPLCAWISGVPSFSYEDIRSYWIRTPALWPDLTLITSLKALLQIQPHWELGLQHINLEGTKVIHKRRLSWIFNVGPKCHHKCPLHNEKDVKGHLRQTQRRRPRKEDSLVATEAGTEWWCHK